MKIYLIDKVTNSILEEFENVQSWGTDFVEYLNNGQRSKTYCNENQYFTDMEPKMEVEDGQG